MESNSSIPKVPLVSLMKKEVALAVQLTMLAHAIIKILVHGERIIVVLGSIHPIFGDVQVHAVIPRFRNTHSVVFQRLSIQPKVNSKQLTK